METKVKDLTVGELRSLISDTVRGANDETKNLHRHFGNWWMQG